ncbi:MAG: Hint domain-containing protein, partial [Acidocella sp.]|nr:Hint domain-containing protein [Acidocella sp.]
RPVRWVGWRTLDLGPAAARHARPVIIMPNAFGQGKPYKLLRLSPLHCVYADGVLIPVVHLVNHATILHDYAAPAATYYHVELDRHDILLAEGLECESYFDNGNRGGLYRELGRRSPARRAFAPNVTAGARLAAVRRRLHEIALAAGFSTTYWPNLRAVAAGQGGVPEFSMAGRWRMARFSFPQPAREITLFANAAAPADTDPDSEDRRELGICLGEMRGVRLGAGWQPRAPDDEGVWMGRVAELRLTRARRELLLPIAAIAQSWMKPQVDGRNTGG